jgi:1,4-dihydroxy-2-naphthoate octaprenyltransferase
MWKKAVTVVPNISRQQWDSLDLISKWLISTRAAVLVMTVISATLAGLFAIRDHSFQLIPWLALTIGLVLAHASNNLLNDYTDYSRGVDQKDYYRSLYGPQPLVDGLMTKRQNLTYLAVTGALSLCSGLYLFALNSEPFIWILIGIGAFFLLFYTWPMKHLGLGELAVLIVWGPLMIGGGYYVLTHRWDWNAVWASLPYALGVTTVIFGKHIDKLDGDSAKGIHTLPVLIGERAARHFVIGMMILPYLIVGFLIATRYFAPPMMLILFALPRLWQVIPAFLERKPAECPADFPKGQGGWPLYFAPLAFVYNRTFGSLFVLSLLLEICIRISLPEFWGP